MITTPKVQTPNPSQSQSQNQMGGDLPVWRVLLDEVLLRRETSASEAPGPVASNDLRLRGGFVIRFMT